MNIERKVKKTRAQKKSKLVAIVASVLTAVFSVGVLISALRYPNVQEIDHIYNNNELHSISELKDNGYLISATSKNENNEIDNAYLYKFDKNDNLLDEVSLFSDASDIGVTNLKSFDDVYTFSNTNSLYAVSQNHLFYYTGLEENELTLIGHTSIFQGRIMSIATSETDLYVISQVGPQYRVDRFQVGDTSFEVKATGYIYGVSTTGNNYKLDCSKNIFIYSSEVIGNYLYLTTSTCIRRIHRDMNGINFRNLFEAEVEKLKTNEPELTVSQRNTKAKTECISKYGWVDYDFNNHTATISKTSLNANDFTYYNVPLLRGVVRYFDTFFFIDESDYCYTYSVEDLDAVYSPVMYLSEDELAYREDIKFSVPLSSEVSTNAICYYGIGETCVIFHESNSSVVTILDLEDQRILYSVGVSTRISDAFYNEDTDYLFYKYQDPVNKVSGVNYLSTCLVANMLTVSFIQPVLVTFIIATVVSLITALVCWFSFINIRVMNSVIETGKGLKKNWPIYIILFPTILILCMFCYYPGIAAIGTSFYNYTPGISNIKTWNNFGNYVEILTNPSSISHFANMLLFLVSDVVLAVVPPLIFGFFLTLMRNKKLSGILRTALFIPGIIPGIAGLLIWKEGIYGNYGLINTIISNCGGEKILFFVPDDYTNMLWLIMMGFPFVGSYLIFYGAMMNIPSSYYEAAELDGISVFKRFIKIDVPLCVPQIKYVVIMTIISSIQNFSRVYIAMGKTNNVVSTPIVEMYMLMNGSERNIGLASAYATILFVILFGLTFVSMRSKYKEN